MKKKKSLFDKAHKYGRIGDNLIELAQTLGIVMSFLASLSLFVLAFSLNELYFVIIPLALILTIPAILLFVSFIFESKKCKIIDAVLDGEISFKEYHGIEQHKRIKEKEQK